MAIVVALDGRTQHVAPLKAVTQPAVQGIESLALFQALENSIRKRTLLKYPMDRYFYGCVERSAFLEPLVNASP